MRKAAVGIAAIVLLAVVAAMIGAWWLARSGMPRRSGTVELSGLESRVEIRWNDWAVPHVAAASPMDLARAVGYLHANDRFTQMELGRRLASGRLAEVVGDVALPSDRYHVSLDFRRMAAAQVAALGPENRGLLEGYAQGVNAWIEERGSDLPPEIRVLGIDPEPWTPRDSLYFQLQMAHELSFWQGRPEETRFRWLVAIGRARLGDLLGYDVQVAPEILAAAAQARDGQGDEQQAPAVLPAMALGSNNWALAPGRTASGDALVANDPHLPLAVPGFWYQMVLRAPGYEASGMTLPGLPWVIIGQGPAIAWAFTNVMLDDHDIFFEQLDETGARVRRGDRWLPLETDSEAIRHRDGSRETVTVRRTDHGVLLEAVPDLGLPARSLAWTAAYPSDAASVFLRLARADRVAPLLGALDAYIAPAQNLVAADAQGDILHVPLGRIPARRSGDGRMPSPGWNPAYGWDGLLPGTANPARLNPESGILVTANHDFRDPPPVAGAPTPLTADFDTPHRAQRIRQLLERRRDWRVADMAAIQTDVVSLYALQVVSLLDPGAGGDAGRALELLRGWDGDMSRRGPAALYAILQRELLRAIFDDEGRRYGLPGPGGRAELLRLLRGDMDPTWFDDVSTPETESRREILAAALDRAWTEVTGRWGDDPGDWDYGALHTLSLDHPLAALPVLGARWSLGPFPVPGSATTVAAFGARWRGDLQDVIYGPSMRWIADPANPDAALAVLPAGQSGHPEDRHYADQLPLYLAGEMRPVQWSERAVEASTVTRMALVPESPKDPVADGGRR